MAGVLDPPVFRDQTAPGGMLSQMLVKPPADGPLDSPVIKAKPLSSDVIVATDPTIPVEAYGRMITVDDTVLPTGLTPRAGPYVEPPKGAGLLGTLDAAADSNATIDGLKRLFTDQVFKPEPGHNPLDIIQGTPYEQAHLDRFVSAQSEGETRAIMQRIDQEELNHQIVAAGGFGGWVAAVAAGSLDPVALLPLGGWMKLGKAVFGATRLARSAATAGAVAASVAGQEAALHAFTETRTNEESFWAVAGSAVLGGVLGAAGHGVTPDALGKMAKSAGSVFPGSLADDARLWDGSLGAATTSSARGTGELKGALGAEKLALDPMRRLQTSRFQTARDTVRDLAETPLTLAENADGVPTTIGGSVETQAKMAQGPLAESVQGLDQAFSDYFFGRQVMAPGIRAGVARVLGRSSKMSFSEFKEATFDALLAGDVHPIPEVAAAARSFRTKVFDPLKNDAIGVRLFEEDIKPADDAGYVPRVYDRQVIRARTAEFVDILAKNFEARRGDLERVIGDLEASGKRPVDGLARAADLTPGEIKAIAQEVTDTILGFSPGRMMLPRDIVAGPRGPLKERVLRIPTSLIRDFVERDPVVLARMYSRTMATDIGLIKKFGSTDLAEQIRKVNDEAQTALEGAPPKESKAINAERDKAIRDIEGIRDRVRGTYGLPDNPEGLAHRASSVVRNLNYLRLLGGMTLSAPAGDAGRMVAQHGLTRVMRTAFAPFVRGMAPVKLAANEVKLAGAALDMVLDSRVMAISDVMDNYGRGGRFERGVQWLSSKFGVVSLMSIWNAAAKQLAGVVAQTRMLQAMEAFGSGTIAPKEVEMLAAGGIDSALGARIAAQFAAHGEKHGEVWWANTSEWTDKQAIQSFRAALIRDVDKAVIAPGQDKPLFMSKEWGKVIGQFKTFQMAATQRYMVAGLQSRDAAAFNGLMVMLTLGAMQYWVKAQLSGLPVSDNPAKWATEAFDQSGITGWLMDANNVAEKWTGGHVGLSAITGETASRYSSRGALGALLGPSSGIAEDVYGLTSSIFPKNKSGEDHWFSGWSASDTHTARRLLPLQNLLYLRGLFDKVESGTNGAFGIPARKN